MKNLQKHFMNITKKVSGIRPILKNVYYDEKDNRRKATDSYRALTYINDCPIEKSIFVNPINMEYSTNGNYPDLDRIIREIQCLSQYVTFNSNVDLNSLKKAVSKHKRTGELVKIEVNGRSKEAIVKSYSGTTLYSVEIESIYDEKAELNMTLTGMYFYHMIDFLSDYRKEFKNQITVCLNTPSLKNDIERAFLVTDNERFNYVLTPVRIMK